MRLQGYSGTHPLYGASRVTSPRIDSPSSARSATPPPNGWKPPTIAKAPLSRAHARTREGLRPPSGEAVTVGLAALGPVTYHAGVTAPPAPASHAGCRLQLKIRGSLASSV